jgi:nucleoside-triphosphatase THEP1
VSGNKTGISVYILGLKDKKYLAKTYGNKLGKASVTGYCIRFKALKDINMDTLEAAIRDGLATQDEKGKLMK